MKFRKLSPVCATLIDSWVAVKIIKIQEKCTTKKKEMKTHLFPDKIASIIKKDKNRTLLLSDKIVKSHQKMKENRNVN